MKKPGLIIGDSSALPPELIQKYGITEIVPFIVDWPEQKDISKDNIYKKMKDAKEQGIKTTPKTSQPAVGTFKKAYDNLLAQDKDVLCLTLSSKLSGAFNSAIQAKKLFDEETQKRIFILDTLNVDVGEALLVIRTAELIEKGESTENIFHSLESLPSKVHLFGMLESPKWLEAGGRISSAVARIMEKMQELGMRPILKVKDGEAKPANFKMQAKDTATALFKEVKNLVKKNPGQYRAAISHADNLEEAKRLEKMVQENLPEVKIEFINVSGFVIGAHVGPGTILIALLQEQII